MKLNVVYNTLREVKLNIDYYIICTNNNNTKFLIICLLLNTFYNLIFMKILLI